MDVKTALMSETVFRPELFFDGRADGAGVIRDTFGKLVQRWECKVVGSRQAAYGALAMEQTYSFGDGTSEVWKWVITPGGGNRYIASEQLAGSGIGAECDGEDFTIHFNRPDGRAKGWSAPHYAVRFTLLTSDSALMSVKISRLGAPLGAMTGFYRRVG